MRDNVSRLSIHTVRTLLGNSKVGKLAPPPSWEKSAPSLSVTITSVTSTKFTYNHSKRTNSYARMGYKYISKSSPFLSSFISFYPTQGHPTKASGIHSNNYPTTWIQRCYNKGPHSKCTLVLLHALVSTARISSLLIIP